VVRIISNRSAVFGAASGRFVLCIASPAARREPDRRTLRFREGPRVRRLSAGGRWIRTSGSARS
jgi:hypothetical protein